MSNQKIWWFYILECVDKKFYYGSTCDLRRRFRQHNEGKVRATRHRRPCKVVYFEICESAAEVRARERQFKNGRTRRKKIMELISLGRTLYL